MEPADLIERRAPATRVARGYRMGWISPPARRRTDLWPGDIVPGSSDVVDGADVPRWVNGPAGRGVLVRRLAFVELSLVMLGGTYLLMAAR
jgi:hypothetical protein